MKNKREETQKLHPQTHSAGVDCSLFIMVTMVESLEKMDTTPAAPHQSFPSPICSSRSPLCGFVFLWCSLPNVVGGLFLLSFLCQVEGTETKIDGTGATRWKRGFTRDRGIWPRRPTYFPPRTSLCALPWLLLLLPSKKLSPKILGHLDVI